MSRPKKRILFVSSEVSPFTKVTDTAHLVRHIPEILHNSGEFETRIMMPRYGTISERRNRLHEVVRLSGNGINMGDKTETLKVKVASIPGIRLQVYFMDSVRFFKRKGLHEDKQGQLFPDNAERALFFARCVIETLRKLRWKPDIIHAFGWISGLLPLLLVTEYAAEPLFEKAKIAYTPDGVMANATFSSELVNKMNINGSHNGEALGLSVSDVGLRYSHVHAFPPSFKPATENVFQFCKETDEMSQQAFKFYDSIA